MSVKAETYFPQSTSPSPGSFGDMYSSGYAMIPQDSSLSFIDLDILVVDMEDLILELIKRADIVDHLPDKVGWIVVDARWSLSRIRNTSLQIGGVVIRFCPPGHWSSPKASGSFR